jgi:nicotinate-nucleotide adenylyltransferase
MIESEATFQGVQRLGLMGGTFNPVHLGHLRAAEEIAEFLSLDRLIFMPAAFPPHKPGLHLASFEERLHMLNLAVSGQPAFAVSDLEGRLTRPSYNSNTLREVLKRIDDQASLFFLVGFDSFRTVSHWHEHQELFKLASFVVFRRPGLGSGLNSVRAVLRFLGSDPDVSRIPGGLGGTLNWPGYRPIHYYFGCRLEISSTDLRHRLTEGQSVRYLVPDSVREHIAEKSLYHYRANSICGGADEFKKPGLEPDQTPDLS